MKNVITLTGKISTLPAPKYKQLKINGGMVSKTESIMIANCPQTLNFFKCCKKFIEITELLHNRGRGHSREKFFKNKLRLKPKPKPKVKPKPLEDIFP
jgi:hypothetical protein